MLIDKLFRQLSASCLMPELRCGAVGGRTRHQTLGRLEGEFYPLALLVKSHSVKQRISHTIAGTVAELARRAIGFNHLLMNVG